jgi:HPt (histidine-containing phosphotransfer) domain-containing protein
VAAGVGRTPIVAVTANAMRGEEERCLEAGMDGYLAKPVAIARLGAALGRWIEVTPPAEPPSPAVDRTMLRTWLGDDEATLRSVLVEFLANTRENARDIETALAAQDMPAVASAAHKLKGGALSVGARALQEVAARLEAGARPGDWSTCRDLLAPLERELRRAAEDIEA